MKPTSKVQAKGRKAKPFKPSVKRWAYPYEDGYVVTDVPPTDHDVKRGWCRPVALLDLTAAASEERVEMGAKAMCKIEGFIWSEHDNEDRDEWRIQARAVLRSLGLMVQKGRKL